MRDLSKGIWDPYSTPQLPSLEEPWRPFIARGKDVCSAVSSLEHMYLVAPTSYWLPDSSATPYQGRFAQYNISHLWNQTRDTRHLKVPAFLKKFLEENQAFVSRFLPKAVEECPKELRDSSHFALALRRLNLMRDYLANIRAWKNWAVACTTPADESATEWPDLSCAPDASSSLVGVWVHNMPLGDIIRLMEYKVPVYYIHHFDKKSEGLYAPHAYGSWDVSEHQLKKCLHSQLSIFILSVPTLCSYTDRIA